MVGNLPANAGDTGSSPGLGKIPHAAEQLGPWATTTEPARLEPVLCKKRGRDSERPVHRDEEWPPLATTRESPRTETKTEHSQKKKKQKTASLLAHSHVPGFQVLKSHVGLPEWTPQI